MSREPEEKLGEIVVDKIKGLNIFIVFQLAWIVEIYYLMINALYKFMEVIFGSATINNKVPQQVADYNTLIMKYLEEYWIFVTYLGIALIVSGGIISTVKMMPKFKNYRTILVYSGFGIYSGGWMINMGIIYYLYNLSSVFFPIILVLIVMITILLNDRYKFLKNWLYDKGVIIG